MLEALLATGASGIVTDNWVNLGDFGVGRYAHTGALIGEWLYIHGGVLDGNIKTDNFIRVNLETLVVEDLAIGPAPRWGAQMAAVNGQVYLYGGRPATGSRTQDLWRYDPSTDQWTQLANGPNPRERGTLVEVGGMLYLVGGQSTTEPLAQPVQRYDPIAGTWTAMASMSQIRYDATAVAIGTLIYLHGGFASADNNMLWVFDTVANTWGVLAVNTGTGNNRSDHWAGVADDKMYIGGGNSQTNNDIYMYDPQSGAWNKRKAHVPRQFAAIAVSYNGKVYVHGNSTNPASSYLWCYTP